MKLARGFSVENDLIIRLLLLLCVRKMELCAARWENLTWPMPCGACLVSAARLQTN